MIVRKKALYFLFSVLILLSGTFSVAPMAFCTMKAPAAHSSCCNVPVSIPASKQPIRTCDLCKLNPAPANISLKTQSVSQHFVTLLPFVFTLVNSPQLGAADYSVIPHNDSSPPLYLRFCNFRSWSNPCQSGKLSLLQPSCRMFWYALGHFLSSPCCTFINIFIKDQIMNNKLVIMCME